MHDVDADELLTAIAPAIADAIIAAESPCDECHYRTKCATERLACGRFVRYLNGAGKPEWSRSPASPTAWWYATAFEEPRPAGRPLKRITAAA